MVDYLERANLHMHTHIYTYKAVLIVIYLLQLIPALLPVLLGSNPGSSVFLFFQNIYMVPHQLNMHLYIRYIYIYIYI